jgi:MoaA/NifB/PqqE/SkfB family radical SAM enzyme
VLDPAGRLSPESGPLLARLHAGTLVVPDRGVPIHPASVAKVAELAGRDRSLCFVPEIPVATELGLPRYEPILGWFPGMRPETVSLPRRILRRLAGRPAAPTGMERWDFRQCDRIALASEPEQIHHFVDHFAAICPSPIQVSVVVGNACNLHCVMCPYHSPQIKPSHTTPFFRERRLMTWEMMERVAAECGAMGAPVKTGNVEEPLVHPRIVDFVRECRRAGVPSVHITTNGTLLTPAMGRSLLEAGLTSLYVSLDAARPDTYRRIRHGELDRVEGNIRAFLASRRAGGFACRLMLSLVRNEGVSAKEEEEFLARWLPDTEGVILYHLARYDDGNSRFDAVHEVARAKVREAGRRWACLNPWQEVYLLPDGRVYCCCETISKLAFELPESMGRFPDESLGAIWHGAAFRALRRDLILNELARWPACDRCGIWMAHVSETVLESGKTITRNMITEIHQHAP